MPILRVRDIIMNYEIKGRGQPVVLISELGEDLTSWQLQVPAFASDRYMVVLFDNRGAGHTDAPDIPYSMEMMAEDTIGLLDELGIDSAHVVGVSMGGRIAQEMAIRHPSHVKSLVLAATSARPSPRETFLLRASVKAAGEGVNPETIARFLMPWILTERFFDSDKKPDGYAKVRTAKLRRLEWSAFSRQVDAMAQYDSRDQLVKITAPTLVLAGRDDLLVPLGYAEELVAGIQGAQLIVLDSGHLVLSEAAYRFNKSVLEFWVKLDGGP